MKTLKTGLDLDPGRQEFFGRSIDVLRKAQVPFLVGGAFAVECYTGVSRETKDFDVFVRREDMEPALEAFKRAGYRAEFTFPHWLGKAFDGERFIDIIFSSGNGVAPVDEVWFEHATQAMVFGRGVDIAPPEETIWSKAFIMERERYDGADVAHLLNACGPELDWHRLIRRFESHWRVLLVHLTLLGYIYPSRRDVVPAWVMRTLWERLSSEINDEPIGFDLCRGTVLSRAQYLADIEEGAFVDGRLHPWGLMTEDEIRHWTEAIPEKGES